jgi:hypothetical protein
MEKKKNFSCPVSMNILWHHGLIYDECPLEVSQRDMGECASCPLKMTRIDIKTLEKIELKRAKKEERAKQEMKIKVTKIGGGVSVELDPDAE